MKRRPKLGNSSLRKGNGKGTRKRIRSGRTVRVKRLKQRSARKRWQQRGYNEGFSAGYEQGHGQGVQRFGERFEGTSIIIPSYNQAGYLKLCVESIMKHTEVPYEIIVVDNGSTDETAQYLRSLSGKVRYRLLQENRGFAGAVNVGLMMAKGQTLLLLNNDTLVTERWLSNMLQCLGSDERIGMVGPVTNYISGDQQIDVPYQTIEEMEQFARDNNVPDSARWQQTDRMPGFCLLFRRQLWERTGYFDEGYEIGNYEDDDFNIRVRLQGYSLVIARNVFIHHFGSVSMRALGDQFMEVDGRNQQYYVGKWGDAQQWVRHVQQLSEAMRGQDQDQALAAISSETAFYPQYVAVQALSGPAYWIEGQVRRPIAGDPQVPITRVSKADMLRWPIGEPIAAPEVLQCWSKQGLHDNGQLGRSSDGSLYWLEPGVYRRVVSSAAALFWNMNAKPAIQIEPESLEHVRESWPIIAPVHIAQRL